MFLICSTSRHTFILAVLQTFKAAGGVARRAKGSTATFNEVRLILVGNVGQLPPIVGLESFYLESGTRELKKKAAQYALESPLWPHPPQDHLACGLSVCLQKAGGRRFKSRFFGTWFMS